MRNPIVKYILQNHILATVLLVGLAFFLFEIRSILLTVFLAYIIMAALHPFVRALRKRGVPKIAAILIVFSIMIAFIVLLVIPLLPFFISQIQALIKAIPEYINTASQSLGFQISTSQINSTLSPIVSSVGQNAVSLTSRIFGSIFSIVTLFILSFYMLIDRNRMGKAVSNLLPDEFREKGLLTIHLIEEKLGAWMRGQVVLSLTIGIVTWVVLTLLGVPFALPLAIMAGFLEIIPTLGPVIAAVPAIIVALAISPIMALTVIIAYIGIQLAENNILVPKIMQKAVGLNPVVIIIAILVGANLFGIMGALLSIPFISAAIILIRALDEPK